MGLEDFTTYTEVDTANNRIVVTSATHVDHAAARNEDTYLYKDYGAAHFATFEHLVDAKSAFDGGSGGYGHVWMLANELDDEKGLLVASKTYIGVNMNRDGVLNYICLIEGYATVRYSDLSSGYAANTPYYLKIEKSGTALTCKIYSDSARTTLLDTLSLVLHANHSFRYVFACNTYNDGSANLQNNDIDNLSLHEPQAFTQTVSDLLGLVDSVPTKAAFKQSAVDILGMVESITKQKSIFQTVADSLGMVDAVGTKGAFKQAVSEVLGMVDSASRSRGFPVTISEILGLRDRVEARRHAGKIGDLPDHVITGGA